MATTSSGDDRKFAVFSTMSVQTYAESIGIEYLPETVVGQLAEDVSYRVREMISKSCEFMRHARRKKLKSSDVDRALYWSNVHSINGAHSSLKFNSADNVHFMEDSIIDLKEVAFGEIKPTTKPPLSLSTQWLTTNDMHRNQQYNEGNTEKEQQIDPNSNDFALYYSTLVECILSDNKTLFGEMLKDMRTNPRIGSVVPYFVNFVAGANLVSHDLDKVSWMLQTVKALFSNRYISLRLHLKSMLSSVMYCVLEPLAASINPLNDHWLLRDYGGLLLSQIVYSHSCERDFLLDHLSQTLVEVLCDPTRPLCSHYGAMATISQLGCDVIHKILSPILEKYVTTYLLPVIEDLSPTNTHTKEDAHKVLGATMRCIERMHYECIEVCGFMKSQLCYPKHSISISEKFGDSLVTRLPLHDFKLLSGASAKGIKSNHDTSVLPQLAFARARPKRPAFQDAPKLQMSDVFESCLLIKRSPKIRINFGKPVVVKYGRLQNDVTTDPTADSSPNAPFELIQRRKLQPRGRFNLNASLLSWL